MQQTNDAPRRSKNLSHSSLMSDSHHSVVLSFVVPFISSRFSSWSGHK
jgi:hypothetical protein